MFVAKFPQSRWFLLFALVLSLGFPGWAAEPGKEKPTGPKVHPASDEGELAIKKFKAPEGFKIELFAAEPMLANPVCFAFDEQGRVYVVETFRHTQGAIDSRQYMQIVDEELASK